MERLAKVRWLSSGDVGSAVSVRRILNRVEARHSRVGCWTAVALSIQPALMSDPAHPYRDIHSEAFLHRLMRRQLVLSILCASAFLVALVGLPLLNYLTPELMSRRVAGFTLSWLVLGVLFFPFVWAIAWVFIGRSIRLETQEVDEVRGASSRIVER